MPEEPSKQADRPLLAAKSSAARKLISINDQTTGSSPSTSRAPAQIPDRRVTLASKSTKRTHFAPDPPQNHGQRTLKSVAPEPGHFRVAAARKYTSQDDRRLVAGPSSSAQMSKKTAPRAALWAPSMRPLGPPNSEIRPHQQHTLPTFGRNPAPNYTRQGTSSRPILPLPLPDRRRFSGAPLRKSAPLIGPPPHDSTPGRFKPRHSLVSHMTPSDTKARKTMHAIGPAWLTADASYRAHKPTRVNLGWKSVSSMSMSRAGRSDTDGLRMVDEVKAQIRPGLKYRLEGESDSDDMIEIDEVPGAATHYRAKAARKYDQIAKKSVSRAPVLPDSTVETTSSDEKSDLDESESPEIDELDESDIDSDATDNMAPSSPPEELMTALEALTLTSIQMQKARRLPFLLRDMRRGFERRCQLAGIPTLEERQPVSASVVYKLRDGGAEFGGLGPSKAKEYVHKAHMTAWRCPLCELHGRFKTRQMLRKHLTSDHDGVDTTWEQLGGGKWQITLIIPESTEEDELLSPLDSDPEPSMSLLPTPVSVVPSPMLPTRQMSLSSTPVVSTPQGPIDAPQPFRIGSPDLPSSVFPATPSDTSTEQSFAPAVPSVSTPSPMASIPPASPVPPTPLPVPVTQLTIQSPTPVQLFTPPPPRIQVHAPIPTPSTSPIPPKFKYRSPSPTPSRLSSHSAYSRARSTTATSTSTTTTATTATTTTATTTTATAFQRRRQSKTASVSAGRPSRYPTPPPPTDPLGPSAQYPYLPFTFGGENSQVDYSARPGGPYLYDLLNGHPMEPFGVLSWSVVDKEEEIFESGEVRDEDKVMQALWGRWIMLNRNEFVAHHYDGTVAFVEANWKVIHRAAGWAALRVWLLMLVLNRFITGSEVAKIIKRYEELTGMAYWYSEQGP